MAMRIIVTAGMSISIPKGKNATDWVKQSVTIELDPADITRIVDGTVDVFREDVTISKEEIDKTIEVAQNLAADRVWEAITQDLEELGVT